MYEKYSVIKTIDKVTIGYKIGNKNESNLFGTSKFINLSKMEAITKVKELIYNSDIMKAFVRGLKDTQNNMINFNYPFELINSELKKIYMVKHNEENIVIEICDYEKFLMLE